MSVLETSISVLRLSNDGDDLSPYDLKFIENCANYPVSEKAEVYLNVLEKSLENGSYKQQWLCGVEYLTQDHEGYIYYKGAHVEHYSFRDYKEEREAAIRLKEKCLLLEENNIEVSCHNAIWNWDNHDFNKKQKKH